MARRGPYGALSARAAGYACCAPDSLVRIAEAAKDAEEKDRPRAGEARGLAERPC